jgi:nucleoside 2-deoxyribosyltransferase
MRVYLSQPFAGYEDLASPTRLLSRLKIFLSSVGEFYEDPLDFEISGLADSEVVALDYQKVSECDVVVCDLTQPNLGGGVWGEIYYAYRLGIPIIVICPDAAWSSPWIRHHSSYRYSSSNPPSTTELFVTCKDLVRE